MLHLMRPPSTEFLKLIPAPEKSRTEKQLPYSDIFFRKCMVLSLQHQEESYHRFWRIAVLRGIPCDTRLSNASNEVSDPLLFQFSPALPIN